MTSTTPRYADWVPQDRNNSPGPLRLSPQGAGPFLEAAVTVQLVIATLLILGVICGVSGWVTRTRDEAPVLFAIFAVLLLVAGLTTLAAWKIEEGSCARTAALAGVETRWTGMLTGCYVRIGDDWVPIDRWREVR